MDVIKLMQEKFAATKYDTVTEWMKDTGVDLSLQSCTSVLLRGQDKGLVVMLTLASGLKCTPEEMQAIAKEKGDKTLWRLITKDSTLTKEDHDRRQAFHRLTPAQQKMVSSLIKELDPGEKKARRESDKV